MINQNGPTRWRKSSRCATMQHDECVEIGDAGTAVQVRDSVDPTGPRLTLAPEQFGSLLVKLKAS